MLTINRNSFGSPSVRFAPGELLVSHSAANKVTVQNILDAFLRHVRGDWGQVDNEVRLKNEAAIEDEGEIVSIYSSDQGLPFYIITAGNHSSTAVVLAEDCVLKS